MTQHDTVTKLTYLIKKGYYTVPEALKVAYALGFDYGRDRNNHSRAVLQLTMGGEYIDIHDSMNQAGQDLGIDDSVIGRAAHGKLTHAGGYKWRFLDG